MSKLLTIALLLTIVSCSSKETRHRDSDKSLRTMIDPNAIDPQNHVTLQNALISSGKWYVIDRSKGFKAVLNEQDRQHKVEQERFSDKNKYAHFGELYGVGSIVVPHLQCATNDYNTLVGIAHLATLGTFHNNFVCSQYLELIDTSTGEVLSSVRHDYKTDSPATSEMNWSEAVEKLNDNYPKYFEQVYKSQRLENYEAESAEKSQRSRETANEQQK